jgi:hypothetical protein
MEWKMYLLMIAFLTTMLSVLLIVSCSVVGNVILQYKQSKEKRIPGNSEDNSLPAPWRLPLFKAVPLAVALAWLVVHFIVKP